ncbi:MAG: hypothetical protein JNM76_09585 [Betaproteobacteria bacterium]|nr:hypothetical protein [Betaproteobacteria bacterium]
MKTFHHRGSRIALVNAVRQGDLALEAAVAAADITPAELLSWLREHGSSAEPSLDDLRLTSRDRQLRELRRQVRRLESRLAALRSERTQLLRMVASPLAARNGTGCPREPGTGIPMEMGMSLCDNASDPLTGTFL